MLEIGQSIITSRKFILKKQGTHFLYFQTISDIMDFDSNILNAILIGHSHFSPLIMTPQRIYSLYQTEQNTGILLNTTIINVRYAALSPQNS